MAEKIKKLTFNRLIDYLETDTKIQLFCDDVKVCEPFNVYSSPDIYSLYDFHACEVESVKADGINQMSIYIKGNTEK